MVNQISFSSKQTQMIEDAIEFAELVPDYEIPERYRPIPDDKEKYLGLVSEGEFEGELREIQKIRNACRLYLSMSSAHQEDSIEISVSEDGSVIGGGINPGPLREAITVLDMSTYMVGSGGMVKNIEDEDEK